MFQRFFPNEYYDSTYHIDFHAFYDKGYRAVLFDVDNTLVEHDAPANARAKALIQKLKDMGYKIDKKCIKSDIAISSLGVTKVVIELHKKVKFDLNVELVK